MERKGHYFLFLFLLLFPVVISEVDVNPQLQTKLSCTGWFSSPCDQETSFCNSEGKCQCRFGYTPDYWGSKCERFHCSTDNDCSQQYQAENAHCLHMIPRLGNRCFCKYGFHLNAEKCVFDDTSIRPLGARCIADHQCSTFAKCTVSGTCQCRIGTRPDSTHTCRYIPCSSDEFCHTNVTANTVCEKQMFEDKWCECREPNFEHDDEEFTCVATQPPALKLGAKCSVSTRCGDGAKCTTGSEPICKCQVGYEATTDNRCEPVRCSKDWHCHKNVSPLTSCYYGHKKSRSFCWCKEGYYENPESLTCTPNSQSLFLEIIARDRCLRDDNRK